jgi:hypothetical protein
MAAAIQKLGFQAKESRQFKLVNFGEPETKTGDE